MTAQTITQTIPAKFNLLRRSLQADGLFETVTGVGFILGAQPLADLFGLPAPAILVEAGVGLLLYAVWLFYIAAQPSINRRLAFIAASLNAAWVVGSWLILLTGWVPLTSTGWWANALINDIVAVFAILQFYGLWQTRRR